MKLKAGLPRLKHLTRSRLTALHSLARLQARSSLGSLAPSNDAYAFTLAEVLITLGIIGVVAALTLPSLIANHKKQVIVTQLKKAYSAVYQAIEKSKVDYGDIIDWDWDLSSENFMDKYIVSNMQVVENCRNRSGCWSKDGTIYSLGGEPLETISGAGYAKVKLPDGTYLALSNQKVLAHLYFDLNGEKLPNKYGIDAFIYTLTKEPQMNDSDWALRDTPQAGLYAFGHNYPRSSLLNNCKVGGDGRQCGALIMLDGWKMSDDYPGK